VGGEETYGTLDPFQIDRTDLGEAQPIVWDGLYDLLGDHHLTW
jgi:hypothetical protein